METRTTQDLLAERRANCLEAHRSTDTVAKENLRAHVALIDTELANRRARRPVTQWASYDAIAEMMNHKAAS